MNRSTRIMFARIISNIINATNLSKFQKRHAKNIIRRAMYHLLNHPVILLYTSSARKFVRVSKLRERRTAVNMAIAEYRKAA